VEKGGGIPWHVAYLARYRSPFRLCRRPYIPRPYPNGGLGLGYPGFGNSDAPPATEFRYTFDHLAQIIDGLTLKLGLRSYVLYNNDYGGPIGMRLAVAHPERVKAIIVQNAVAHEEGLGPAWDIRKAFWKDRAVYEDKVIPGFTSLEGAKGRHLGSSPHPERYDPEAWNGKEHIWRSLDSARFNPACSLTVIRRGVRTPIGVQSD